MTVLLASVISYGLIIGIICEEMEPAHYPSIGILDHQINLVEFAGAIIGFLSFITLMSIRWYEVEQKGPMIVKPTPKAPEANFAKEQLTSDSDEEAPSFFWKFK